jgi:hypothetical protein
VAAMKFFALWNRNERSLIALILLFVPLKGAIGNARRRPWHDLDQPAPQHAHEFLESLRARPQPPLS